MLYQPTAMTIAHRNYLATWNKRLDEYRDEFRTKAAMIQTEDRTIFGAGLSRSSNAWQTLVNGVFQLSAMVRDAYTIAGRGEALSAFITHMETSTSPGLTDVWFLRQVEDWQKEAQQVDRRTQAFFASFDERVRRDAQWIREIEELAKAQGMLAGKGEELKSLYQQAISYWVDQQSAQAEDQYRAAQQAQAAQALLGIGLYLNQLDYQQQLLNTLNRPRTCTSIGNTITCN